MPSFPNPTAPAGLRAGLRADAAAARPGHAGGLGLAAALEALILVLLARLFARTAPAWHHAPDDVDEDERAAFFIIRPTMGRAPHAAVVEAGLVPDWVLSGMRNRGLRPAAAAPRPRRRSRPARAPPAASPVQRQTPLNRGAPTHAHNYSFIEIKPVGRLHPTDATISASDGNAPVARLE